MPLASPPFSPPPLSPVSSAPFEWIHFEGRSVKTTLNNLQGVDSLARDRRWRSQCVFSIDVGRRLKQGVEASSSPTPTWSSSTEPTLKCNPPPMPTHHEPFYSHSRVSRHHTRCSSPTGAPTAPQCSPSQRGSISSPHGGWRPPRPRVPPLPPPLQPSPPPPTQPCPPHAVRALAAAPKRRKTCALGAASGPQDTTAVIEADDSGDDSDGTEIVTGSSNDGSSAATRAAVVLTRGQQPSQQQQQQRQRTDDAGALDAFVAGMIYALSRRLLPGVPYMPGLAGPVEVQRSEGGRWKLNECLRFVTELAGHKACRRAWDGLGKEMAWAGWFDG